MQRYLWQQTPRLSGWTDHTDAEVKYFSGTARTSKTLRISADLIWIGKPLYRDLGSVAVIAEGKLNGNDLGILCKRPFRVDVAAAAGQGDE